MSYARRYVWVVVALLGAWLLTGSANAQTVTSEFPELAIVSTQSGGNYTVYSGYWETTTTTSYDHDTITLPSGAVGIVEYRASYGELMVFFILAALIILLVCVLLYTTRRTFA